MDLGSIFLILALAALVAAFVGRPFWEGQSKAVSEREHELWALMAERDRLLEALLELDFDHKLGKVPEEIYPGQREALVERGADTLRQIDLLGGAGAETAEDPVEAAIARRRAKRSPDAAVAKGSGSGAARQSMKADKRPGRGSARARYCTQCGKQADAADKFCANCGNKLA